MAAAIHGVDVVGKAEHALRVAVVVLQRDLHGYSIALGFHINRPVMQHLLAAVQMLHEFGDAAGVLEFVLLGLVGLGIGGALVGQSDEQALVEEGQLAQALAERIEVVFGGGENLFIGDEVHLGAAFLGGASFLELAGGLALGIGLLPDVAIAPDLQIELVAESIHHAHAHAVQSAGNFVRGSIEFAAGMQLGHDYLGGGNFFFVNHHVVHGDAAAVINHGDGVINVDGDFDLVGKASQGLIH